MSDGHPVTLPLPGSRPLRFYAPLNRSSTSWVAVASAYRMLTASLLLTILLLLGVANGSPLLAAKVFNQRLSCPVDGGCTLSDGQPVFGDSKTVRGVVVSICSTT